MNLLQAIVAVCTRTGIPKPNFVVGSSNSQIVQLHGLANEVCEELGDRWNWEALTHEAVFTTVDGDDQGLLSTHAPFGISTILRDTFFDRSNRRRIWGPMTPEEWQIAKALPTTGPEYSTRIRGGHILVNPPAAAGLTWAFEYMSKFPVQSAASGEYLQGFVADDDEFLLDDRLLTYGIRWKWKYEKGLTYAEDLRRFEELANSLAAKDNRTREVSLEGSRGVGMQPGIIVPTGNWNLP